MTSSSAIIKDDVILHWHVLFDSENDEQQQQLDQQQSHKVATKFAVVADEIAAVVVVPRRSEIMNMAVISGQQVTTSMRIFSVSIGAKAEDVTAISHCISADAKILKTSPTCTSVYVDGSESNGSSEIHVYAHFLRYTTSFAFRVWYPKIPLTIWTSSSILYSIRNWKIGVWRDLAPKRPRAARQFSCANRFQQSQIRILASMWMEDTKTGEQLYLSSHKNILFDVTNIVHNTLHVSNRSVATLRYVDGTAILSGQNRGNTQIQLRNMKQSQVLASENIMVHNEQVAISGISTRPICHVALRILPILFSPAFLKLEMTFATSISKVYEQCSIDSSVSYSDGTWEPLSHVDSANFDLAAHSNDDRSLAVSHHFSNVHLIAIDETRPSASVEIALLASSQCSSAPLVTTTPLAVTVLSVPIHINSSHAVVLDVDAESSTQSAADTPAHLPAVPMHIFVLTVLALIVCFVLITFVRRSAAFKGYEQLVVPLLSRLSSSSGSARHEDTNEWVWLSRPQPPTSTLGSDYSADKTFSGSGSSYKRQSSNSDDPTRTSISYHGSEISVFIAPSQANIMVNSSRTRHALVDSNSDHNLARVVPRDDKWHNNDQFHTWTWKQRERLESVPIRESVA